ncbi:phosphoribosyltransferase family protein [Amycolatopsis rhabdoformis]|uniref:Phosphoribosyltransferase family protein n=1 Tax=Amycolatopsis rhabdoformis TaxID=1448059 RepID=A0ABZ1I729_9PSEU|nr:phosphoribosyltransferase family protein [Amycolatopsis rhabdoformis]WSE30147.1 phosphoribosyltransferase family protein [Amycolatopsis rhabdoformis]
MRTLFHDRIDAGRQLGRILAGQSWVEPVVLGLPRGGVPVAAEVARALGAPLDVVVARKIGAPGRREFGVGAVTAEGPPYYSAPALHTFGLTPEVMAPACERERAEARRRLAAYRGGRPEVEIAGHDVLVIDDGLATGVTAMAAVRDLRDARRVVLAVPVCAPDAVVEFEGEVDGFVAVAAPRRFDAVGRWYADFTQVSDATVVRLLGKE